MDQSSKICILNIDTFEKLSLQQTTFGNPSVREFSSRDGSVVIRPVRHEGRVIRRPLIALPYVKGNRTLLGMDFLQKVGIVLNLKRRNWFFSDSPHRTKKLLSQGDYWVAALPIHGSRSIHRGILARRPTSGGHPMGE
ncbi:hypothetical protein NPIL_67081 [Nephila pilipes]|uniref:Uncharacterized protein n=1 Tax=Nephila pilipes TaxID=299642 RepID=A0A8X6T473_NEPPI|nr:hypothetical protein NPIL_67081 [Nephila pilipes]